VYNADSRMRRDINRYLHGMDEKNLDIEYIRQSRHILFKLQEMCAGTGIYATSRIGTDHVRDFMDTFRNLSGAYRRFVWAVVRCFLADSNNTTALKFKLRISGFSREHVEWLSADETEKVLATPMTTREAIQIRAGLLQGLRKIEVVRMTVKDASSALLSRVLVIHGKGGRARSIPVHPGFAQALEAYLRDCPYDPNMPLLGIGACQSGIGVVNFSLRFGRRFTSHTLRRSFGRNLWLKGVDILTISELMGHSSVDMTRRYLGLNISDMKNALTKYTTESELKIIDELPQRRMAPERPTEIDDAPNCPSSDIRNKEIDNRDAGNSVNNLVNEIANLNSAK